MKWKDQARRVSLFSSKTRSKVLRSQSSQWLDDYKTLGQKKNQNSSKKLVKKFVKRICQKYSSKKFLKKICQKDSSKNRPKFRQETSSKKSSKKIVKKIKIIPNLYHRVENFISGSTTILVRTYIEVSSLCRKTTGNVALVWSSWVTMKNQSFYLDTICGLH